MSKNKKGMICLLNHWEWDEWSLNRVMPDCRNHRHLSRRRLYERTGQEQFADRTLAQVYDSQGQLLGHIVEVARRTRWCGEPGDQGCRVWIDSVRMEMISAHLNRFQSMIDAGRRPFEIVKLPKVRGNTPGVPPLAAAISETLKSHSPCAITAKESELNASGAMMARKVQHQRE